ncbi:MAG: response regulator [Planctomycetota bacterium]|nr:response regulator [Planctomycetota bacterium]
MSASGPRESEESVRESGAKARRARPREDEASRELSAEELAERRVFTTGEAAQICKVSQQTIIRCFDAGRLAGFKVPGSKFRRIPRDELIRFMRANDIPLSALEGNRRRVLVVDDDAQILEIFEDLLRSDPRIELRTAGNGYDAGLATAAFKPHLIVLDFMLPDVNGDLVCRRVRERPETAGTRVLFMSGTADEAAQKKLLAAGGDAFLKKPFNIAELRATMHRLMDLPMQA